MSWRRKQRKRPKRNQPTAAAAVGVCCTGKKENTSEVTVGCRARALRLTVCIRVSFAIGAMALVTQAAQRGDPAIIRALVSDVGVPVDVKDKDGTTPLMCAADYACDKAVQELLKLGADHSIVKSDGMMAVHRAAASARADGPADSELSKAAANATKMLVHASEGGGAASNLEAPSPAGTPFLLACSRGAQATITTLAGMGANCAATTKGGIGAAAMAASSGIPGALRAALAAGAPPGLRPVGGMTALHVAASHPNTAETSAELVQALLDAGADPDLADGEGLKAVHAAAAVGRVAVVEILLKVTTPDEGVAPGEWTSAGVQKRVQEKLKAIAGGGSGRDASASSEDLGPYEVTGVKDAEIAATTKRTGDEKFIKGDMAGAIAAYDASLGADDTNAKVWANRAAAKLKVKDYRGALRDARTAREIDETYVKAYYREGCAMTELGDYENAAMAFFKGMEYDSGNKDLKKGFDDAIARGRAAHVMGGQ